VEAVHAEADVILRHRHLKPSLRLLSTHQDFWDPHLQHTMLHRTSPHILREQDTDVGVAVQNGEEEPTGDTIGAQFRAPKVMAETNSIPLSRR
jgi:hypothetical protein